jgi:hypothetical protein
MNKRERLALILLGAWLVLTSLLPFFSSRLPAQAKVLGSALGLAAALAIVVGWARRRDRESGGRGAQAGMLLLAVWLVFISVLPHLNVSLPWQDVGLALLAILAGAGILLD